LKCACKIFRSCAKCGASYRSGVPHVCGNKFCKVCKTFHHPKRQCFIKPLEETSKIKATRIVVFDFEVLLNFNLILNFNFRQRRIRKPLRAV
jgi:hypothetical protein